MKDYTRIVESISSDTSEIRGIDPEQYHDQMFVDLHPLFKNKESLKSLIESDLYIWQYGFLLKMKDQAWFLEALQELLALYNEAYDLNKNRVKSSVAYYFPKIRYAYSSQYEAFHLGRLQELKSTPSLFVREAFKDAGSILEAGVFPLIQHSYDLISIAKGKNKSIEQLQKLPTGQVINELGQNLILKQVYFPLPHEIAISQWRNIAQHQSFIFNEATALVECTYGTYPNQKKFEINYKELAGLLDIVNKIQALHKISLEFFCADHENLTDGLVQNLLASNWSLSKDNVASATIECLIANGFKVRSFDYDDNRWRAYLFDKLNREEPEVKESLAKVSKLLAIYGNEIELYYHVVRFDYHKPIYGLMKLEIRQTKRSTRTR